MFTFLEDNEDEAHFFTFADKYRPSECFEFQRTLIFFIISRDLTLTNEAGIEAETISLEPIEIAKWSKGIFESSGK